MRVVWPCVSLVALCATACDGGCASSGSEKLSAPGVPFEISGFTAERSVSSTTATGELSLLPEDREVPELNLELTWRLTVKDEMAPGTGLRVHYACQHGPFAIARDLSDDLMLRDVASSPEASLGDLRKGEGASGWTGTTGVPASFPPASRCEATFEVRVGTDGEWQPFGTACVTAAEPSPTVSLQPCPDEISTRGVGLPWSEPSVRWTDDGVVGWIVYTTPRDWPEGRELWQWERVGDADARPSETGNWHGASHGAQVAHLRAGESYAHVFGRPVGPDGMMELELGIGVPSREDHFAPPEDLTHFCLRRTGVRRAPCWTDSPP